MTDGTIPARARRRQGWHWATVMTGPRCSRRIVNFPDSGRGPGISPGQLAKLGIDPNSPQFQSARRTCLKPLSGVLP